MTDSYWSDDTCTLYLGDCRDVLPGLAETSVDAIICDPPYELAFMSKSWDASGVAYDPATWAACLRVLKPGGHLMAFGAPRTYHRMVCAIEDAGFEIRDSLHWIRGDGFPKGQDVGKSIDRHRDERSGVLQVTAFLRAARNAAGLSHRQIDEAFGFNGMASHWTAITSRAAAAPTLAQWSRLRELLDFDDAEILPLVEELNGRKGDLGEAWSQREVTGYRHSGLADGATSVFLKVTGHHPGGMVPVTAPASESAQRWHGWNTQLKPAHEPIVLARRSTGFDTTVANVLRHGTGALNVNACRTATSATDAEAMKRANTPGSGRMKAGGSPIGTFVRINPTGAMDTTQGRWPTNLVLTHSAACAESCAAGCPVAELDQQSGHLHGGGHPAKRAGVGYGGGASGTIGDRVKLDAGGASRFFPVFRYEAKAPASERPRLADGTAHATVKPLALMRWLVRLVTPPGGLVLDPFAGSGTTGEACAVEGFRCVLVEKEQPHAELIKARLSKPLQAALGFEEGA